MYRFLISATIFLYHPKIANSMSSSASDRPQYPRTQYNRPPHISTMDPSLSQQNIPGGSIIHSPENPYAYDVVPTNYR